MKLNVRFAAAALTLAAAVAPRAASAAPHLLAAHAHHTGPSFPMKADDFRKYADGRIEHVRDVVDKKLDRHGVSVDRKKAIHKVFDEIARDVRTEVDKAAADGIVTQAEGDKVKALTLGLRARLRERLRTEKDPKAKAAKAKAEAAKAKSAKAKAAEKTAATKPAKGKADKSDATKPAKSPPSKAPDPGPENADSGAEL